MTELAHVVQETVACMTYVMGMQERVLDARLERSSQREVFEAFLRRYSELVCEEERLMKVGCRMVESMCVIDDALRAVGWGGRRRCVESSGAFGEPAAIVSP